MNSEEVSLEQQIPWYDRIPIFWYWLALIIACWLPIIFLFLN